MHDSYYFRMKMADTPVIIYIYIYICRLGEPSSNFFLPHRLIAQIYSLKKKNPTPPPNDVGGSRCACDGQIWSPPASSGCAQLGLTIWRYDHIWTRLFCKVDCQVLGKAGWTGPCQSLAINHHWYASAAFVDHPDHLLHSYNTIFFGFSAILSPTVPMPSPLRPTSLSSSQSVCRCHHRSPRHRRMARAP